MFYTREYLQEQIVRHGYQIGEHTYGCPEVFDFGEGKQLRIGRFCSIAAGVRIYLGGNHRTDWITTYPFGAVPGWPATLAVEGHPSSNGDVVIGNDVWLGAFSSIMSGIVVGDGAVIAAGAVVTKPVEPYAIVGGNPARLIRYRFDEDVRGFLMEAKWWDWPEPLIAYFCKLLCTPDIGRLRTAFEHVKAMRRFTTDGHDRAIAREAAAIEAEAAHDAGGSAVARSSDAPPVSNSAIEHRAGMAETAPMRGEVEMEPSAPTCLLQCDPMGVPVAERH